MATYDPATGTPLTKSVEGYFGKPKEITREDFIARWKSTVADCYSLTLTTADYEAVVSMIARVEVMAGRKWDAMKA